MPPPPAKKKRVALQEPPTALLSRLLPRVEGYTLLDTARVVFESAKVRELAGCDAVPARIDLAAAARMELRYTPCLLAFGRLVKRLGEGWLPAQRPRTEAELEELAELLLDKICRAGSEAAGRQQQSPAG